MAYNDGKHKVGDKVWVYAFNRMGGKSGHFHNIKPAYGLVIGYHGLQGLEQDFGNESFNNVVLYKTKKSKITDELSSKTLSILQIKFADSYEEAVEKYNKLVNKEADFYREKLEQVNSYLIN